MGACLVDEDGYLRYLVVRDGFRNQGWGTKMMQFCAGEIVYLDCGLHLTEFYRQQGFEEVSEESRNEIRMIRSNSF